MIHNIHFHVFLFLFNPVFNITVSKIHVGGPNTTSNDPPPFFIPVANVVIGASTKSFTRQSHEVSSSIEIYSILFKARSQNLYT